MGNSDFIKICKDFIVEYVNQSQYETTGGHIPHIKNYNVFVVWVCKTLQNNKALLSTNVDGDTRYYEIAYNGDKREFYFDCYEKINNTCITEEMYRREKDIEW